MLKYTQNILMRAKIRLKVKRHEKTKKSEIMKWVIGKLHKKEVQAEFINYITANVQSTEKKWKMYMKYVTQSNKE
jgi:hypoxanthine phosphoribosyltransferase